MLEGWFFHHFIKIKISWGSAEKNHQDPTNRCRVICQKPFPHCKCQSLNSLLNTGVAVEVMVSLTLKDKSHRFFWFTLNYIWPAFLASLYFFPPSFPILEQFFVIYILEGGGSREWYVQRSPLWDQQDCHSLSRDPLLTRPQRLLLSFVFHIIITILVNLNKIQEPFEHFFVN